MKINSNLFNFQFFLSNKKKVKNLEESAKIYGGATKNLITGDQWSNIEGNEFIVVNEKENNISIFIPDTINTNQKTDNKKYIEYITNKIFNKYQTKNITFQSAIGSWYSEELDQVIYDNITIVNAILQEVETSDINYFISLANYIKKEMSQEGVSILINNSLAII